MDSGYGTGTNIKHPRRNTKANGNGNGNIGDVRNPLADSKDERGNSRHPRIHQGVPVSEGIVAPAKRLKSFSSGSSSASNSSSEDFIQVDPKLIYPRASATAPSPNHVRPLPIYYKTDLSSDTSSKSERDSRLSTGDSSQVSGITHESPSHSPSVTESPPIQVMERPSGFDPNRIPPSVFASKSPSPIDWSVASNESLFSIHIGNNSFSRDRVLKLSGELHKSGELEKIGNKYISNISFSPSPPVSFSPSPPVARRKESDRRKFNLGRDFEETEKPMIETPVEIAGDQIEENYPAQEMSFNRHSNGSELPIQTVVLPLKKKHETSSWSCSNCSCRFCCSAQPSCCLCKWPSCNGCSWPSCNCCKWPSCSCCKLPSCNSCCKKPSCSCCTLPSCSCCKWSCSSCCKWPSCSSCSRPSCSCCKWSSGNCSKWPSCTGCCKSSGSCCKWPSCSGCRLPNCSCCKWPSCSCKWPNCNCCKWPSCSCSACPSCSCRSWAFCFCWNSRRKRTNLTEGRHAELKSSKRWYSCFVCCSNPC